MYNRGMKVYIVKIYNDDTNAKLEKIKKNKNISFTSQFRRGLKLLFAELEKEDQENENKKTP